MAQRQVAKLFSRDKMIRNKLKAFQSDKYNLFRRTLYEQPLNQLIEHISLFNREFSNVVFMGHCLDTFIENIPPNVHLKNLIVMENDYKLLQKDLESIKQEREFEIHPIVGDEELIAFKKDSIDLIVCNNNLTYVNDLPFMISRLQDGLQPDGIIVGSIFGEETLQELRIAFNLAENERSGGVSPHIVPFQDIQNIGNIIYRLQFKVPTTHTQSRIFLFDSVFDLMQFLQEMGENSCLVNSREGVNKDVMYSMAAIYQSLFNYKLFKEEFEKFVQDEDEFRDDQVIATFENIYFSGWKHDPNIKYTKFNDLNKMNKKMTLDDLAEEVRPHLPEGGCIRIGEIGEDGEVSEKRIYK